MEEIKNSSNAEQSSAIQSSETKPTLEESAAQLRTKLFTVQTSWLNKELFRTHIPV